MVQKHRDVQESSDATSDSGGFGGGDGGFTGGCALDGRWRRRRRTRRRSTLVRNVDRVLTNVVVRDKKTGELIKGLKAERLPGLRRQEAAAHHHLRLPERRRGSHAGRGQDRLRHLHHHRPREEDRRRPGEQRLRRQAGRVEGPPSDRHVLRPQQHAAGGHNPRGGCRQGLHQQPHGAGRPGCLRQPGLQPQHGPGLHQRQAGAAQAPSASTTAPMAPATHLGNEGGDTDGTSDDSSSFVADDSEFNALNTDRQLYAIRTICKSIEKVEQKKSMLYFSGGLTRQGIENQASIRAATNECVKADTAMYAVDTRGLQALNPVGDASQGSRRGTSAYSGASMQSQLNSNFSSQETLGTLASDTGGKLFVDSNDFAPAFQAVQHDTEAYYIIGYQSTNPRRDGTYRHLTINAAGPSRRQARVPARILRPSRLPARQDRGPRTGADRADAQRNPRHRRRCLPAGALLPAGRTASSTSPSRWSSPARRSTPSQVKDKDKATIDILGQVKRRPEHRGRPGAADGEPRRRRQPAGAEEERAVLHRLHPRPRQVPRQVRRAREPVRQHGQLRDRHPGPGHEEDCRSR